MMVEENKKVFSPATMLIGTILGSAAFYHFTHTITQKVGEKVGDVFGTELASTLISHFTKNPDALSNILGGFGVGGGGNNNNNNNNNRNNNNSSRYPAGESPKERKQKQKKNEIENTRIYLIPPVKPLNLLHPHPHHNNNNSHTVHQPHHLPPPQPIRAVPIVATPLDHHQPFKDQ